MTRESKIGAATTICTDCQTDHIEKQEYKGDIASVCGECGAIKIRRVNA